MYGWTQDRNPRSVHPAVPRHRLTRRLVTPSITEPFKVIAVQLGNSISRLRPITKETSIRCTRNAGIPRQRRSTRYTLVVYRAQFDGAFDWLHRARAKEKYVISRSWKSNLPLLQTLISRYEIAIYIDASILLRRICFEDEREMENNIKITNG